MFKWFKEKELSDKVKELMNYIDGRLAIYSVKIIDLRRDVEAQVKGTAEYHQALIAHGFGIREIKPVIDELKLIGRFLQEIK